VVEEHPKSITAAVAILSYLGLIVRFLLVVENAI
jgi:hypothetical protein